ncbi:hypothetical protein CN152_23685, partial [Sinorhizobium meliloti]
ERPSGRATPSLRDAPGDAPIQIDAVPKLIVAPQKTNRRKPPRNWGGQSPSRLLGHVWKEACWTPQADPQRLPKYRSGIPAATVLREFRT